MRRLKGNLVIIVYNRGTNSSSFFLLLGAALLLLLCDGHGLREERGETGETCSVTWWTVLHTTIEFLSQYVSSQLGPEHSESQI